jgi:hypothetical protein
MPLSVSSTSSTLITSQTTPSTTAPPANSSTTSTDLSSGAKAGIGIGVAAVVLAAAGLIFWLLAKRRRNAMGGQSEKVVPVEMDSERLRELEAPNRYEMVHEEELPKVAQEMEHHPKTKPQELYGDDRFVR